MGRELTPAELDELLGAYALDALDGDERHQVELWLARTPTARRDVDEMRETASLLAYSTDDVSPDLWSRIEDQLSDAPPPLRLAPVVERGSASADAPESSGSSRRTWLVGIAAAVALVVAVSVGVLAMQKNSDQDARLDRIALGAAHDGMRQDAMVAAMEPGARVAQLAGADGTVMAKVVTTSDGRGYFMDEELPTLSAGRTYQLWALMTDRDHPTMISVGVLGRNPSVGAFTTDATVIGYAVTEESAPGVGTSTQPPMMEGWLA